MFCHVSLALKPAIGLIQPIRLSIDPSHCLNTSFELLNSFDLYRDAHVEQISVAWSQCDSTFTVPCQASKDGKATLGVGGLEPPADASSDDQD